MLTYVGGKSKLAREISAILKRHRQPGQAYVEPFAGGGAMLAHMTEGDRYANDAHPFAAAYLDALSHGTFEPTDPGSVPPWEAYDIVRANADLFPPADVGFVGFSWSFGGKWWSGYRRDFTGKRDYVAEAARKTRKHANAYRGALVSCGDYRAFQFPPESLIYCDPPYAGTYGYSVGKFDHAAFHNWAESQVLLGCSVFVSEYTAPDHWAEVWSKERANGFDNSLKLERRVDRLFQVIPKWQRDPTIFEADLSAGTTASAADLLR